MPVVRTSLEADNDLSEIAFYTVTTQGSLDAAHDFVRGLWQEFELIAINPNIGRVREDIKDLYEEHGRNLRSFPVNTFVVYYRPVDGGIYIYRILHSSRDFPASF